MTASDLEELMDFSRRVAAEAGQVVMDVYSRGLEVDYKSDRTPVTEADRRAEQHLRQRIEQQYPQHAVEGEELGVSGPEKARYRWVLDPVDGTESLVRGVPLFGTLVGLLHDGEPVLGVARFPALGQTAWGARGLGAFLNDTQLHASSCARLGDALLCMTGMHFTELAGTETNAVHAHVTPLLNSVHRFRGWSDCFGHILVASGRAEIMLDPVVAPWDVAALVPILTESGAVASTLAGHTSGLLHGGSLLSAAPGVHAQALQQLRADA